MPSSTLVSLKQTVEPEQLKRFQQLNSATVSAVLVPGVTHGPGAGVLAGGRRRKVFPKGYAADYAGESRQYEQEGTALLVTFFFSIIIIYLVLAAQFESFRDPLIMLVSVPMSICGALIFISLGLASREHLHASGLDHADRPDQQARHPDRAIRQSDAARGHEQTRSHRRSRQRPPSSDPDDDRRRWCWAWCRCWSPAAPGAVSRFDIGLVIFTGMAIGTAFTLFVVPTIYLLLAKDHHREPEAA